MKERILPSLWFWSSTIRTALICGAVYLICALLWRFLGDGTRNFVIICAIGLLTMLFLSIMSRLRARPAYVQFMRALRGYGLNIYQIAQFAQALSENERGFILKMDSGETPKEILDMGLTIVDLEDIGKTIEEFGIK